MENQVLVHNLSPESLRDLIKSSLEEAIVKFASNPVESKFMTRQDACKRLHISLPTLNSYVKKGLLRGHKIGRRVLFEEEELRNALQVIPSIKYNRTVRR